MFKSAVIGFFSALLVVGALFFFGLIGGSDSEPVTVSAPVSAPVAPPTLAPVESFFGTQDLGATTTNPEDAPTPPAEVVTPDPVAVESAQVLPPCPSEDSTDCFWDAKTRGNGEGRSFENVGGEIRYTDSDSSTDLPLIREDGWILAEDGTYVNPNFYSETDYTPPASFLPAVREDGWILAEDGTYVNPHFYDAVTPVTTPDPIVPSTAPVAPSEPVSTPAPTPAPVIDPVASEPVNIEPESEVPGIPATDPEPELTPLVWDQPSGEIAGEISSPTVDIP